MRRCLSWNEKRNSELLRHVCELFISFCFWGSCEWTAGPLYPRWLRQWWIIFWLLMFCCVSDHTVLLKCLFWYLCHNMSLWASSHYLNVSPGVTVLHHDSIIELLFWLFNSRRKGHWFRFFFSSSPISSNARLKRKVVFHVGISGYLK